MLPRATAAVSRPTKLAVTTLFELTTSRAMAALVRARPRIWLPSLPGASWSSVLLAAGPRSSTRGLPLYFGWLVPSIVTGRLMVGKGDAGWIGSRTR